ncbi:Vasohibin-domain-containing protein [Pavlovales sp. CCMP2436]|nr:Vasohibin-domain-containing protein [Pavlovales sp. CCMP2436]
MHRSRAGEREGEGESESEGEEPLEILEYADPRGLVGLGSSGVYQASAADGSDDADSDADDANADAAGDAQLQEAIQAIRADPSLAAPPIPTPPQLGSYRRPADKLRAIQAYIDRLQYNHTGVDYFDVRKNRPLMRILETARLVMRTALPIKCVEGVFVGILLTQGLAELERLPIGFKSRVEGRVAKHIILAVRQPGVGWGALGLSRRKELYYKELGSFPSLDELYSEFKRCYEAVGHRLVRVRLGLPVPHDSFSTERVCWAYRTIGVKAGEEAHSALCAELVSFSRSAPKLAHAWRSAGGSGKDGGSGKEGAAAGAAAGVGAGTATADAPPHGGTSPARQAGTTGARVKRASDSPKKAPADASKGDATNGPPAVDGPPQSRRQHSPRRASPKRPAAHLRV